MLIEKYKPKNLTEIIGHDTCLFKIKAWAHKWNLGQSQQPLLLWGKSGIGKTSIAVALAKTKKWEIIISGPDEYRNKTNVEKELNTPSFIQNIFGTKTLLLIEDIECFFKQDRGGLTEILKTIKNAKHPIIITSRDKWDKNLSSIRAHCYDLELKTLRKITIYNYLKKINELEKYNLDDSFINEISINCAGDLRAALIDLESKNIEKRDVKENIFSKLDNIFRNEKDFSKLKELFDFKTSQIDFFMLWIEENIVKAYKDEYDIFDAYENLAKADLFNSRIYKRQNYSLIKYVILYLTVGIAYSKQTTYFFRPKYIFPDYLRKMATSKKKRSIENEILKKISKKIHTSKKKCVDFLNVLKDISFLNNLNDLKKYYGFNDEELSYLFNINIKEINKKEKNKTKEAFKNHNKIIKKKKEINKKNKLQNKEEESNKNKEEESNKKLKNDKEKIIKNTKKINLTDFF